MTIADIIRDGKGSAGSGGAWQVERVGEHGRELWHYSTRMLAWVERPGHRAKLLDYSTGHGSVSDQGGMNTAFRVLGLPYRFDRDARGGGPRISDCEAMADAAMVLEASQAYGEIERQHAETTRQRLEAFLPDVTLIGPAAGAALHALVYGGAA
jgi:hypothetical protein